MTRAGRSLTWLVLIALAVGHVPTALADECPERIDEATALIREAEQFLTRRGTPGDPAAIQEQLRAVRTLVDEAQTLHKTDQHDASLEKVYAALTTVKEVLKTLKP